MQELASRPVERFTPGNLAECSTESAPMLEFLAQGSTKNTWSASK
jgi:hypothetical protein